jgi:hypothetical protein
MCLVRSLKVVSGVASTIQALFSPYTFEVGIVGEEWNVEERILSCMLVAVGVDKSVGNDILKNAP